jgi:hypothetical protein
LDLKEAIHVADMVLNMEQEYRKLDPLQGLYREKKDQERGKEIKKDTPLQEMSLREGGRLETIRTQAKKAWLSSDIFPFMKLAIGPKSQLSHTGRPQEEKNVS